MLTEKEQNNRNRLKETKPLVYEKNMRNKGKQIPRIQLQWRTHKGSCNFHCSHCSVENVGNNKELITYDDVRSLFKQADELGISRVTISGGEPLTFDLTALTKAIDMNLFYTQLDTNAWLLTEDKIKELVDLRIDCIAPSLDSLNFEEHDAFRNKPGSAERVMRAFDLIQKYDFNTFVQTVVTKTRLYSQEFKNFLEYFNSRDIGVFVSLAKPVGAYSGCFDEMVNREDIKYLKELEKEYKVFTHLTPGYGLNLERNCVAGKNIFAVTSTGDCLPCIYHYMSIGNIKEEPFRDIYERMQKINIYNHNTCPMADRSAGFVERYVVPLYGRELPVSYEEILTEEDFDE